MPTNPLIIISLFTGYALTITAVVWAVIEIIGWLYDRWRKQ
jgi:ABC-type Na+ efflux pump permease subunit